ncbi:protein LEG1 homolog [Eublepharis macularius]|uniref:Protein LEG1 homolog n=1 Tax=Eublepharis macularius TaxID=481883 RepID=A0AA97LCI6_EUBMA|nr:protein LEG1 homolog [Eublepharis macularius]
MALLGKASVGLRPSLCHLILLLFVAPLLSSATAETWTPESYHDDAFPPLWHLAPGNLEDYPIQGNKVVVAAWNYKERMGLYKLMLNHSAKYFAALGANNEGNILWGLPLQHGWQYRSGRLADPLHFTSCGHKDGDNLCLSVHNWWACANYALSIIPFLAAVESGFFGNLPYEIEMLPPDKQKTDFCHNIVECNNQAPKVMAGWREYFKYLLFTARNPEAFSFSKDEALKYMWKAHVASLSYGLPKCQNRLKFLSGPESAFGEDWGSAVDFIAATHFSTDQKTTNHFQTRLPPRKLIEEDRAPLIADFTSEQNKVLAMLSSLRKTNERMGGTLLGLWKMAMSTEAGRKAGRAFIENFL